MNPRSMLYPYQEKATLFQMFHKCSACWIDMGLGKTIITLGSIAALIEIGFLESVIVVAPIRVCRLVWRQEAAKWEHTNHLTFSTLLGERDMRGRSLIRSANVYLINYENLQWLGDFLNQHYLSKGRSLPFQGIVWDEISKMKNSSTQRVRSIKRLLPHMKWITGLTGTPAGNGFKDLHGQYLVLDEGVRLGTSKTQFKGRWYKKEGPYKTVAYDDTEIRIRELIGDITLEMSAEDYNPLPDMVVNDVWVDLPEGVRKQYDIFERDFFLELDNGQDMEVFNAASLTNKLLQFSNGAVYPVPGVPTWVNIHDAKLDALGDILEEAQGKPVLCAYAYRSDAERIMGRFKEYNPINLTSCKSEASLRDAMERWKSGSCGLMIGHPASMGHGVDGLQDSCGIMAWFGMNWSLDLVLQFIARIRRQGQTRKVICHRILTRDTLDEAQVAALESKEQTQTSLRKAVKDYRERKR